MAWVEEKQGGGTRSAASLLPNHPGDEHREEASPPNHSDFSEKMKGWNFQPPGTPVGQIQQHQHSWVCTQLGRALSRDFGQVQCSLRAWAAAGKSAQMDQCIIQGLWPLAIISNILLKRDVEVEGKKKNLFSPLPVPPRIFICVCQEQVSLPTFSSWCVLLCGALLARRAGRSSEGTPREKIWAQLSNFSWVCFSAPPLPLIPGHPCGNPSLGRADLPDCPSLQEDLPCQDDPVDKRDKEMRILGFNAHLMLWFICPRAAAPQEAPTDTSDPPEATLLFPKGREQPLDARCFSIRVFLIFPFSTSSRAARSILEYSLHGRTPRVQQESSTGVLQVGKQQSHVEGNL